VGWTVGAYGAIFKTTNAGISWLPQNSGVSTFMRAVYFVNRNIGWAVGSSGRILKTTNGGLSWDQQFSSNTNNLYCLYFADSLNGWAGGQFTALIHTTDGGSTWASQAYQSSYGLNDLKFVNGIGYAVGESAVGNVSLMIRSTDNGSSWHVINPGTSQFLYGVHFTSRNSGWIAGFNGTIMRTTDGGVTFVGENPSPPVPQAMVLSQNFPNPFNPSTTIQFSISHASQVSIRIFNTLGEELQTLVSAEFVAGTYTTKWDANNISSGLYFYRLQAGDFVQVKKLIVLR
jgi:photosystem II stability/assembly factor-like uncharacterized protein